jgi:hypothetical protein
LISRLQLFGWTAVLLVPVMSGWRNPHVRAMAAVLVVSVFGMSLSTIHSGHYAAPMMAGIGVLLAWGIEAAWRVRIGGVPAGAIAAGAALTVGVAGTLAFPAEGATVRAGTVRFQDARAAYIRRLADTGDEIVVVVRYPDPGFQVDAEWVHNSADIDSQQVIFAHDLGDSENMALRRHYPKRRMWLLTLSGRTSTLSPYEPAQ